MGLFDAAVAGADFISKMISGRRMQRLQEKQWKREDTAVQRRMKDLKAAGINPMLAAGQAAVSTPPEVAARGIEEQGRATGQAATAAFALMQQKADIARSQAETDRIKKEAAKVEAEGRLTTAQADQERAKADFMLGNNPYHQYIESTVTGPGVNATQGQWLADPLKRIERKLQDELKTTTWNQKSAELDKDIKEFQVSDAQIDNAYRLAAREMTDLNPALQELVAKEYAIQLTRYEEAFKNKDIEFFKQIGLGPAALNVIMSLMGKMVPNPLYHMRSGR